MAYEDNPWGGNTATAPNNPTRLGGGAPTLSDKVSQKFGRTKDVASTGFEKSKVVASVGFGKSKVAARKVKVGATVGFNWVKTKLFHKKEKEIPKYVPKSYPMLTIPEIPLKSGTGKLPVLGFGTAADPPVDSETTRTAVLNAIELGYRHFDTAALYNSEQPLGEAIAEAINRGLVKSRDELFVTSKLWCSDAHRQHIASALRRTLENLKMDYIDLYLIHWPVSSKPGEVAYPIKAEDFVAMDFESVWEAMEECQRIGLTKAIGVSNFSSKKLLEIMANAKIQPAVNQVEVNPGWQQKKLIELCKEKGVVVVGYSPLGAYGTFYGTNRVMESPVLKQIAKKKGKTVAQVALRWGYEQGIGVVVKSFNKERMKENMDIFDWSISSEEVDMISEIPQGRACLGLDYTSIYGPYKTIQELWDEHI